MTVVLKIIEIPMPLVKFPDGLYLRDYNLEDFEGLGSFELTADITEAKRWASAAEALEAYRTASAVRPLRPDGRPNRPLTAFTVEVVPYAN
jgi:hypothetical protein